MDINRLYTQAGSMGNNGSLKYTASIQNIPITTDTFTDAYYLGYMKHWFDWQKTTQATYNAETGEISFTDITDYSAYPSIGYGAHIYGMALYYISNYFYDINAEKFICSTGSDKYLLNNFHPQAASMRNLTLEFVLLGVNNNSYAPRSYVTFTSIADFLDFYNGNRSITLTDNYYSRTYTIYRGDLTNDGYYDTPDNTRFVLKQGYFDSDSYYDDNNTAYTGYRPQIFTQSNYLILNESKSSVTFGENNNVNWGTIGLNIYAGNPYLYQCLPKSQTEDGNIVISVPFIGHLDGSFNASEWFRTDRVGQWAIIDSDGEGRTYILSERSGSQYPVGLLWQSTIEDVYKNASLYRWTTSNVYGYSDGVAYYPTFNQDDLNEFTLSLQTGTQAQLNLVLPDWYKLDNIQANDFVDDDKPSPEDKEDDPISKPNDPGKREEKIVGDVVGLGGSTRVQPLSGINYYLLKQSDMTLFRTLLWSQSKTFYQALNIINSVGTDTIFNYFSSLRYYPISNLFNYFIFDPANPSSANVILGNGAVLQGPDGYFSCVVPTIKVYQGVICVWDLSSLPWRHNFLDYSPYSKIVLTLPYAGDIEVDINRIAAYRAVEDVHLYVGVVLDIETGTLTYYGTTAAGGLTPFEQILFEKQIKIAIDLPLSGNDQIAQSSAILQSTYKLASTTLQTASSLISSAEKTGKKLALHKAGVGDVANFAASAIQGVMDIGVASAEATLAKRQVPTTTGDINGTMSSTLTRQYPVLTFYRQKTANPDNYGHTTGYVCEAALTLNSIEAERTNQGIPHAFTVLSNPDLGNVSGATQEELEELMGILTTGFYI